MRLPFRTILAVVCLAGSALSACGTATEPPPAGATGGAAADASSSGAPSAQAGVSGALGGVGGNPSSLAGAGGGPTTIAEAGQGGGGAPSTAGTGGAAGGSAVAGAAGAAGTTGSVVVSPVKDGKETIQGPYDAPPEATLQPGTPVATEDSFTYDSSQIFPGTSRHVVIFIPKQYVAGTPVPFIVIQDGDEQLKAYKTDIVLMNLIHQRKLPVMAALFVNRADNGPKRSLEYDCLDDDYSRFILEEIIPLAKMRHPELKLTDDPNGRGSLGKSSGAPAAFTLGWRHPDSFRRITTFNGSFVKLCKDGPGANEYPGLVREKPSLPLQVYLFSGDGDNGGFAAGNQAMADALDAKGYRWRFVYGVGSTHDNHYAASLITQALLWTWAGYPLDP